MNKKISMLLVTSSIVCSLQGAVLIQGDPAAPAGQTFSFNVNENLFSSNGNFYEATNQTLAESQAPFTLSRLIRATNAFTPICPETVNLNGMINTPNPIFGAPIIALGMLETEDGFSMRDMPVVVAANRQATVYLFDNIISPTNVVMASSKDVHDAQGNVSSGIVDLATNGASHVFAAVKPNVGEFGDLNSGIALLIRGTLNTPQGSAQPSFQIFTELNANTGAIEPLQALLLDPTSPALMINAELANIVNNQVSMHWDNVLQRLFIGLQVTANSAAGDGARSVAVVQFVENGAIAVQTVVPDSVFAPGNTSSIIGVVGAGQQVSVNALNTMYTSTALHYLIVVGGNGDAVTTNQTVYALPLVNTGNSTGMIASKNAEPVNVFKNGNVPRLINRTISEAAAMPADMTQSTDIAAQVGGGVLTAGPIVNIIVRDDTVFAFVGTGTPGVYSSQAIFNASGTITAWTTWQRAAGTTVNVFGAALNAFNGNFILASGISADTVNTVQRTQWSDGSPQGLQPLTTILDTALPLDNGGVQGLQTFLPNSPGLQNISVLIAGGIGAVVLAQTGLLNGSGIIIPTAGADFNQVVEFTDGIITSDVSATTVVISGGVLNNVGPITALEIAQNATNGWLFVGGSTGLAILASETGQGWDSATQLGANFNGLQNGMLFKTVGNYNFVKKLVYDGDFLFVITHSTVDRINLTTSDFGTNMLDVTTIASVGANGVMSTGGFLDGIFSQACGIIATTDGLLRIGDNQDVRTITTQATANWTPVAIGENAGAPTALYCVTQTGRDQDITRNSGGFFYVLTAGMGLDQSRINRFAVQPLGTTDAMNSSTVQPFDDIFVKNIPSFLLSFGEFRSNFATDGALYFATRNQNVIVSPIALLTPSFPEPRVGFGNVGDRSALVNINFQPGTEINAFTRSQASGSWVAAGNFNTQVLE